MGITRRVGVIEIGSRAVRLLVADVQPNILRVVAAKTAETHLSNAVASGEGLAEKLGEVDAITKRFRHSANQLGVSSVVVFGTEAIRELEKTDKMAFARLGSDIHVLDRGTEARCSLAAAMLGFPGNTAISTIMVLDQGAGSLELTAGKLLSDSVLVEDTRRYALGTQPLVQKLKSLRGSIDEFEVALQKQFSRYQLPTDTPDVVVALGSAPTKCAWLKVRGTDVYRRYDSKSVQGQVVPLKFLIEILDAAKRDESFMRQFIDPVNPDSPEFDIVIAGLMAIRLFLYHLGKAEFVVSGLGTRHGLAALIGRDSVSLSSTSGRLRIRSSE